MNQIKIYPLFNKYKKDRACVDSKPNYAKEARQSAIDAAYAADAAKKYAEQTVQDLTNYYTKSEINTLLNNKVDTSALTGYYTKSETNTLLNNKVDTSALTGYYTKSETNTLLNNKADTSALTGYYTKSETDTLLNNKADIALMANYLLIDDFDIFDENFNTIMEQVDDELNDLNTFANSAIINVVQNIGSVTINGNSTYTNTRFNIQPYIPAGYKAITVYPGSAGNNHCYYYNCAKNNDNTAILMIKNTNTAAQTVTPYIQILCLKEV